MKKLFLIIAIIVMHGYSFGQAIKVASNGNVGIGVSNPMYKLHVGSSSVFFGILDTPFGNGIRQGCGLIFGPFTAYVIGGGQVSYYDLYGYHNNQLRIGKTDNRANIIYAYTVNYQTLVQNSDARLKTNIKPCPSFLPQLKDIKTYTYNYTDDYFKDFTDGQRKNAQKAEYGFLAQELQKIFPELVHEDDSTGILSVNYVGLIPILTSAISELQRERETEQNAVDNLQREFERETAFLRQEIASLKKALTTCCQASQSNAMEAEEGVNSQEFSFSDGDVETMKIYQNAPNPFNERTVISCYIPHAMQKAELCVYTMQGTRIKCLTVTERGAVELQIGAGELSAGVYTYFLIGDGKTSEAKQMILTK